MLKKLNLNHNLTNAVLEFDSHCLLIACRVFNVEIIFSPNACRILYVHLMAHFRMYRQIKEQTAAFRRGFRSVINPDLLLMFSAPEFQKLISGDNADLDIQDLRFVIIYFKVKIRVKQIVFYSLNTCITIKVKQF